MRPVTCRSPSTVNRSSISRRTSCGGRWTSLTRQPERNPALRLRQVAPIPDVVRVVIALDIFTRPAELVVEAVRPIGVSLQRPQRDVLEATPSKSRAGRLEQQPTSSLALMHRVHVQPHDVPNPSRVVVGVLSGTELAEPDDDA